MDDALAAADDAAPAAPDAVPRLRLYACGSVPRRAAPAIETRPPRAALAIPAELIICPRLELSGDSFAAVMDRLEHPRPATQALLDLMSGNPIDEDR